VAKVTQDYGIPLHICHIDKAILEQANFQANARSWRRTESIKTLKTFCRQPKSESELEAESSESVCEEGEGGCEGPRAVAATAHHLDDQIETSLLKLVRGTHLSHLHPVSGLSE
jgi:tRNA(Ile)-lysidine synthase TilS/MesJ